MSERRFTEKWEIEPTAVMELADDHPAMLGNRTLFPTTVVDVMATSPESLLVSGENNRKLGKTVEKGKFKGYSIYQLSLEERATCPTDCDVRAACYGNSMQLARRHRIVDPEIFYARLEQEIASLARQNIGLMIRLHVLGDFPSVEYVAFWLDILSQYENVACYGYTHRLPQVFEPEDGGDIGEALESVKAQFPDRFRIRWSFPEMLSDGAKVITEYPDGAVVEDGIKGLVCPAQTDATACCATCAMCWETDDNCVLFLKHDRRVGKSHEPVPAAGPTVDTPQHTVHSAPAEPAQPSGPPTRQVAAIALPAKTTRARVGEPPEFRMVAPRALYTEDAYQRRLSTKSKRLIAKIVAEWDWAKFKPPICAETDGGLFIIDGQHTAIAAATHGGIPLIPVVITKTDIQEQRAAAFVAHNRDRVAMTPFDIFHGELAAGASAAADIWRIVKASGCDVPRYQPAKNYLKPGQITAINEVSSIYRGAGAERLERLLRIIGKAQLTPVTALPLRALRRMFDNDAYSWRETYSDDQIAAAMRSIPGIDLAARAHAAKTGQDAQRACIMLIKDALERRAAA